MRTRTFAQQRDDAYKLADLEGFTDRYPSSEVGRYINQGNAECWDMLVAARGFAYYGKPWWPFGTLTQSGTGPLITVSGAPKIGVNTTFTLVVKITTGGTLGTAMFTYSVNGGASAPLAAASSVFIQDLAITLTFAAGTYVLNETYTWVATKPSTTSGIQTYVLPPDFYKLHQLYLSDSTIWTLALDPVWHVDKPYWDAVGSRGTIRPGYYELRDGYYDIWPVPDAVYTINLWYVPSSPTLVNDTDAFDGINGFEDYGSHWAARKMLLKEGDVEAANLVTQDLNKLGARITNMALERDKGGASRVQDVRGALRWANPRKRYYGRP